MLRKVPLLILLIIGLTFSLKAQKRAKIYKLETYGILPDNGQNSTPLLAEALKKIKERLMVLSLL